MVCKEIMNNSEPSQGRAVCVRYKSFIVYISNVFKKGIGAAAEQVRHAAPIGR